eukprot:6480214-Alexandrium_andersonii.AAC.1
MPMKQRTISLSPALRRTCAFQPRSFHQRDGAHLEPLVRNHSEPNQPRCKCPMVRHPGKWPLSKMILPKNAQSKGSV